MYIRNISKGGKSTRSASDLSSCEKNDKTFRPGELLLGILLNANPDCDVLFFIFYFIYFFCFSFVFVSVLVLVPFFYLFMDFSQWRTLDEPKEEDCRCLLYRDTFFNNLSIFILSMYTSMSVFLYKRQILCMYGQCRGEHL